MAIAHVPAAVDQPHAVVADVMRPIEVTQQGHGDVGAP
jgi:hypothetical protein